MLYKISIGGLSVMVPLWTGLWLGTFGLYGIASGMGWIGQPVEVPLGALLLLILLPVGEIVSALRAAVPFMERREQRIREDNNQ